MQIVSKELAERIADMRFDADGDAMQELVCLIVGEGESDRWFLLDNVVVGAGEFYVEDAEVRLALEIAVGMGLGDQPIDLWHTHERDVGPSAEDLVLLPQWISRGWVYHVPSKTSTSYVHGSTNPNKPLQEFSVATAGEARG